MLHEVTAFVPLFLFFWLFQAIGVGSSLLAWIKGQAGVEDESGVSTERGSAEIEGGWKRLVRRWYDEAELKIEKIGSRYGTFGYEKRDESVKASRGEDESVAGALLKKDKSTGGTVANAISAYVVVKVRSKETTPSFKADEEALMPVRVAASIALAPAFARFALSPIQRLYMRARGRPA
jgi:hypothetical protein